MNHGALKEVMPGADVKGMAALQPALATWPLHATISPIITKLMEVLQDSHTKRLLPMPKYAESHCEHKGLNTNLLAIKPIQVNHVALHALNAIKAAADGALKKVMRSADVKGMAALQPALTGVCPIMPLSLFCPWLSLFCPCLSLFCPRLSLSCPWLSLFCPWLHLFCPSLFLWDKMIQLLSFAVLV